MVYGPNQLVRRGGRHWPRRLLAQLTHPLAAVVYLPAMQSVFGTAGLVPWHALLVLPFPFLVWGVDELWRLGKRRRGA